MMTKTETLRVRIAKDLASIFGQDEQTIAALDLGGYLEDATQILKACQDAGLVFKVKVARVPEREFLSDNENYRYKEAQQDMLNDNWWKIEEIEVTLTR